MNAPARDVRYRIVCVGNRYVPGDDTGPRVYDQLARRALPAGVGVVDGGLGGLNLLGWVEGADRIVFVDSLDGFGPPGEPVVLDAEAMMEADPGGYGHGDGLAYLLRSLPAALEGEAPEIVLVGVEAPADEATIARLADCCVRVVAGGER